MGDRAVPRRTHVHRFIQSFKTFAASSAFNTTQIFRQRYKFEDLLAAFPAHADAPCRRGLRFGRTDHRGRPSGEIAGGNPNDELAMQRYRAAFERLGAGHARYVYEPVGAAFSFARSLDHDATVLVADFGGGTSDFSVMRFSRQGGVLRAEPLGHAGIGIAGDAFDYRIVDHIVSPRLGKGTNYRSFDKVLPIPSHYYSSLARWHQLAMMRGNGDLRELQQLAHRARSGAAARFHHHRRLRSRLRAARAVSDRQGGAVQPRPRRVPLRPPGHRHPRHRDARRFRDRQIADDIERLGATVDKALAKSGVAARDIEKVFLTGGTSFVPAVQHLFRRTLRRGAADLRGPVRSIAYGLALIGHTPDPDRWTVRRGGVAASCEGLWCLPMLDPDQAGAVCARSAWITASRAERGPWQT